MGGSTNCGKEIILGEDYNRQLRYLRARLCNLIEGHACICLTDKQDALKDAGQ